MTVLEAFQPIPRPLVRIAIASAVILGACLYISGLQDQYAPPETMSSTAIAQRVQPVSHVQLATSDSQQTARN